MSRRFRPLTPLQGEQERASSPRDHAALSASAGTGKTHVLTARVLRLLLSGVDPASILCLTFTKAGAAEMADRIHERLAFWVRLPAADLRKEMFALGERTDDATLAKARTLFARVLDAAGGGLRIQTIHAFSQSLLAAFPAEAGLVPGFRPLEGREEQMLARQTLAEMLVEAEEGGDLPLIRDVQALSHRLGEAGAEGFLRACARAPAAMEALGAREGVAARLRRAFGLPAGDVEEAIAAACRDDSFDLATLDRMVAANRSWGTATGLNCCDVVAAWRARGQAERGNSLDELAGLVLTKSGEPRKPQAGLLKADPDYAVHAERLIDCCRRLLGMRRTAALADGLAAGLRAGQAFAFAYSAAKRAAGAVDFDDLIRRAEQLLLTPGMGEWVRYKLDQSTDHILVDEAQDTNERQWNIVRALALEYFAGEGASQRPRSVFTVGDYKQAIFGFQGTDPHAFEVARAWFAREAEAVDRAFLDLSMDRSFRSSPQILEVVDRAIGALGHEALGLPRPPNRHEAHHAARGGAVTLWPPFTGEAVGDEEETGEEGWVSDTVRAYAGKIARQIRAWLDAPFMVEARKRPLRPEDILVLVRRRGDLASLIVARLHAEGVPVAGVDRLLLTAPLAVQDLLAAVRFAVQPLDDLNLAGLLVSPLFGWSQDDLFAAAFEREGALWPRLRALGQDGAALPPPLRERLATTLSGLGEILAMADYATPHQFLETLLSGGSDTRRRLLERLGPEARDPIEELLAAALEFEATAAPSLQRFLDWFARGDVEIVRDPSAPLDAVRVMTVHGSKGLQSPILILADACADPDRKGGGIGGSFTSLHLEDGVDVPVYRPRKDELAEPLASQIAALDSLERQEHWRLLYVALTRAEERLYVGGALGPMAKGVPPLASWHRAVETALSGLGAAWEEDPVWGRALRHGSPAVPAKAEALRTAAPLALPAWLRRPAPVEARPPRPLAPSALGEDDVTDPPPTPALRQAAIRGRLLHQLFERLPDVPREERAERAAHWLQHAAGVDDPAFRERLIEDASRVIDDPRHAELFGPAALAEAPIAAVLPDGLVVAGTVDRLLVLPDRIVLADFKTGRKAPAALDEIPVPHLRQMAAYADALRVIFPGRRVEVKLLYTSAPVLHALPDALLDAHLLRAA
ncbi:double-strand break repair helicase AddA [Sphingomonas parva]|uniref:DNA 3'-5' helicase n=1 Tax=Sphingomonas parva TaxID=2555898 RepID=A0A4Y8ZW88_9SPHN|nr:double-strand break repair helicase AddA [Sphingomonas parva]TFI60311.1 double-strand break repair helicase AddA [Sphingomonas parva]